MEIKNRPSPRYGRTTLRHTTTEQSAGAAAGAAAGHGFLTNTKNGGKSCAQLRTHDCVDNILPTSDPKMLNKPGIVSLSLTMSRETRPFPHGIVTRKTCPSIQPQFFLFVRQLRLLLRWCGLGGSRVQPAATIRGAFSTFTIGPFLWCESKKH